MSVKISTTNSKLGYLIPSVSLAPECSCRSDAPCARLCYGKKGNFTYSKVKQSQYDNFNSYRENPDQYFNDIIDSVKLSRYFRWHTVGDIVDYNYFLGMIRVANKSKHVKFLCFTKKFSIVNDYLSAGGEEFQLT